MKCHGGFSKRMGAIDTFRYEIRTDPTLSRANDLSQENVRQQDRCKGIEHTSVLLVIRDDCCDIPEGKTRLAKPEKVLHSR
jgi:hypothetical protein